MLLTAAEGPTAHAVFAFVTAAQALFGFGCGGEFPVAAASAAERAESTDELKGLRGQTTVLVFSMQVSSSQYPALCLLSHVSLLIPSATCLLSLTCKFSEGHPRLHGDDTEVLAVGPRFLAVLYASWQGSDLVLRLGPRHIV